MKPRRAAGALSRHSVVMTSWSVAMTCDLRSGRLSARCDDLSFRESDLFARSSHLHGPASDVRERTSDLHAPGSHLTVLGNDLVHPVGSSRRAGGSHASAGEQRDSSGRAVCTQPTTTSTCRAVTCTSGRVVSSAFPVGCSSGKVSFPNRTMSRVRRSTLLFKQSSHLVEPTGRLFARESHLAGQSSGLGAPVMSSVLAVECYTCSDRSARRVAESSRRISAWASGRSRASIYQDTSSSHEVKWNLLPTGSPSHVSRLTSHVVMCR